MRQKGTQRETAFSMLGEADAQRERQRERETETERQRQRETERDRERERERAPSFSLKDIDSIWVIETAPPPPSRPPRKNKYLHFPLSSY